MQKKIIFQVSPTKVSYAVCQLFSGEVLHFKSVEIDPLKPVESELDLLFDKDELLNASFDEVEVLHNNHLQTIVPNEFFSEDRLGDFLQYTIKVYPTDYFSSDELSNIQAHNVYVPFVVFNNYLLEKFGAFTYQHIYTPLIEYTQKESLTDDLKFWVYKSENQSAIIVFKEGKLLFFNAYEILSKEDLLYYILFVAEQLYISFEEQTLILLGDFENENDYILLLKKYINQIQIIETQLLAKKIQLSAEQLHQHFMLAL
ncbi:DUF3822 family protein [Capnocytophaga sp. ARDL2]|uniref:DUF3822 family protein n=1 Tax=Capnocytophaga sp. ARDL2 TaxID=3238809 RepID=UPI003558CC04